MYQYLDEQSSYKYLNEPKVDKRLDNCYLEIKIVNQQDDI